MAKGFIRGVLWGAGISLGAVTLISVLDEGAALPAGSERANQTLTVPRGLADVTNPGSDGLGAVPATGGERVSAPTPDTLAGISTNVTQPAAVPETGAASDMGRVDAPNASALEGISDAQTNAPQVALSATSGLETPSTEPAVSVSQEPAQPLAPQPVPQSSAFETASEAETPQPAAPPVDADEVTEIATLESPQTDVQTPAVSIDPVQPVAPAEPVAGSGLEQPETSQEIAQQGAQDETVDPVEVVEATTELATTDLTVTELPAPAQTPLPSVSTVPVDAVQAPAQPDFTAQPTATSDIEVAALAPEAPAPATQPISDLDVPSPTVDAKIEGERATAPVEAKQSVEVPLTQPLPSDATAPQLSARDEAAPTAEPLAPLPKIASEQPVTDVADTQTAAVQLPVATPQPAVQPVKVNRLPTLGAQAQATLPEVEIEPVDNGPVIFETRPVERFAVTVENLDARPVMAVVLIDEGVDLNDPTVGLNVLRDLPYPVSFAVDALRSDAEMRMTAYRDAGFEVLALVDLPEGAQAADAEVSVPAALSAMPEVVAVLEGVVTGVQTTPDAGRQVAQILSQTGHGFVTQNRGLNTVQKLAAREGVPSAVVFRDFDAQSQSSATMRRFLDQAAFRAGQEGGVVMLGRLREETLSALVLWGLQDRASSVAMVPLSAALNTQ